MVKNKTASIEQLTFLYKTFAEITDPDQIANLMTDLCTIRETTEMATRLDVAKMLAQGASYLKIQEATGSSATTIARVSKCINHGAGGYRTVFGLDQQDRVADEASLAELVAQSRGISGQNNPAAGGR
ncbi:MAG: YerC/YecD family TrpR-related protein [Coriobacteriia bacterium]|nr:YerC/YecD family TrpR-related protein [Coriobacteriia bacterium]